MSVATLIVDDEPVARQGIAALVAATPGFHVVGECADGAAAVASIRTLAPDLVLLDVQMPAMSGLDVVRQVGADRMPHVVFITAFDQFAIEAFEVHALDYVLKPFTDERFRAALDRAAIAVRARDIEALAGRFASLLAEADAGRAPSDSESPRLSVNPERLAIRGAGSTTYVPVDDIEWIEADSYYARLHVGGKSILIRETLQSLAARLDRRFVRVHRSAILRVDRIRELRRDQQGEVAAVLRDGTVVPVSKPRASALEDRLQR